MAGYDVIAAMRACFIYALFPIWAEEVFEFLFGGVWIWEAAFDPVGVEVCQCGV